MVITIADLEYSDDNSIPKILSFISYWGNTNYSTSDNKTNCNSYTSNDKSLDILSLAMGKDTDNNISNNKF